MQEYNERFLRLMNNTFPEGVEPSTSSEVRTIELTPENVSKGAFWLTAFCMVSLVVGVLFGAFCMWVWMQVGGG